MVFGIADIHSTAIAAKGCLIRYPIMHIDKRRFPLVDYGR